jgi:hypothetical protein
VVLVGAFSNFFPAVPDSLWIEAIKELLPVKLHDLNAKAFYEGKQQL